MAMDPMQIGVVLRNLISNAVDAAFFGGWEKTGCC